LWPDLWYFRVSEDDHEQIWYSKLYRGNGPTYHKYRSQKCQVSDVLEAPPGIPISLPTPKHHACLGEDLLKWICGDMAGGLLLRVLPYGDLRPAQSDRDEHVIGFHLHLTWSARTTRLLWLITMASMDVYVLVSPSHHLVIHINKSFLPIGSDSPSIQPFA
jgi:hypothetical protein